MVRVLLRPWLATSAHERWRRGVEEEDSCGQLGSQGTVSWRASDDEEIRRDCSWAMAIHWSSRASLLLKFLGELADIDQQVSHLFSAFLN